MMNKPMINASQDFLKLPNYLNSIDPKTQPLRRIVTSYFLNSEYPCGLKGCHQPHKDGFLVELEDGHISNVGWKCGERFGETFAAERNRYAEQELRPKAIATIQETIRRVNATREQLAQIAQEADRLSQYKDGMRTLFPTLYLELKRRAHSGNDRVSEQVKRTEQEIEDLETMNPGVNRERFRYREEYRGVLSGLRILATNIREEVVTKFTSQAEELLMTNITSLNSKQLLKWEGWGHHFDEMLKQAQDLVTAGATFFSQDSFRLLTLVSNNPTEKTALSKLTPSILLQGMMDEPKIGTTSVISFPKSKKEQDIEKRLIATLRKAARLR